MFLMKLCPVSVWCAAAQLFVLHFALIVQKKAIKKMISTGASAVKQELFRFTSGDYTSNMGSAGVAGQASPAAAASRHCFLL